jgi:hypothetical protein
VITNEHHEPGRRQTVLLLLELQLRIPGWEETGWFHFAYVGTDSKVKPEGSWVCESSRLEKIRVLGRRWVGVVERIVEVMTTRDMVGRCVLVEGRERLSKDLV